MILNCSKTSDFLRRQLTLFRNLGWNEVKLLVAAFVVACCAFCFIKLADEVNEGDTQTIDKWILRSLRRADDPSVPIGSAWIREANLDVTALAVPSYCCLLCSVSLDSCGFSGSLK